MYILHFHFYHLTQHITRAHFQFHHFPAAHTGSITLFPFLVHGKVSNTNDRKTECAEDDMSSDVALSPVPKCHLRLRNTVKLDFATTLEGKILEESVALLTRTVSELGQEVNDTVEEKVALAYYLQCKNCTPADKGDCSYGYSFHLKNILSS